MVLKRVNLDTEGIRFASKSLHERGSSEMFFSVTWHIFELAYFGARYDSLKGVVLKVRNSVTLPFFTNRSNFLQRGTIARGAAETGQVEAYMYGKVGRNPFVRGKCAEYKGIFTAGTS